MAHNGEPIVVEESYAVSAQDLWKAVTVKERMLGWYFQIPAFEAQVGFEVEFNVECNGTDFLHRWKIIEVEEGKSISYDWNYGGFEGASVVTFEVSSAGEHRSSLRLTHAGGETFPQDIPEFDREAGVAGWTWLLKDSLKKYLEPA